MYDTTFNMETHVASVYVSESLVHIHNSGENRLMAAYMPRNGRNKENQTSEML